MESIVIREPHALGMGSNEQKYHQEFIERILIACNLLLKDARLSTNPSGTDMADFTPDKPKGSSVTVEYGPDGPVITVKDSIGIIESYSIGVATTDEFDEADVRGILGMMYAVFNDKNPSTKVGNMQTSLMEYSRGIQAQYRETVLKDLYSALEKAVNFDGSNDAGSVFDEKVRSLAGDLCLPIDDIRLANNRLKHSASEKQMQYYPDDEAVYNYIRALRPALSCIIRRRLVELTKNN